MFHKYFLSQMNFTFSSDRQCCMVQPIKKYACFEGLVKVQIFLEPRLRSLSVYYGGAVNEKKMFKVGSKNRKIPAKKRIRAVIKIRDNWAIFLTGMNGVTRNITKIGLAIELFKRNSCLLATKTGEMVRVIKFFSGLVELSVEKWDENCLILTYVKVNWTEVSLKQ